MQTELMTTPAARERSASWTRYWPHIALATVAVLAGVLDFWHLSINGVGNDYYAQAVRAMTESWKAFRYAALDPAASASSMTVDKPPLALWIDAISVRIFGFSSWSLLGPSALAGAVSVAVLGRTVTRLFGVWAGLVAAVALALTPVALVSNRSDNTDGILALLLVLGAWATVRALQSGRWRWVLLAGALFGLAFLTKMLAAFIVLPGIVLAYLFLGPAKLKLRLAQLGAAAAIMLVISVGWMLSVDLTPAADRPQVGSSPNNTEIGLALGWNGLSRIFGGGPGGPGGRGGPVTRGPGGRTFNGGGPVPVIIGEGPGGARENRPIAIGPKGPQTLTKGGPGGNAGLLFGGPAGFTRLLTGLLGVQGSWLLPLAMMGLVSAVIAVGWRRRSVQLAGLVIFGGWTVVVWAVFSFAQGVFHPYYISELAPGIAALVGIGVVALWRDALAGGRRSLLPAVAALGSAAFEWYLLRSDNAMSAWGWAVLAIGALLALGLLARHLVGRRLEWPVRRGVVLATAAAGLGLAALLVAPGAYDWEVITTPTSGAIPVAQAPGSPAQPTGQFQANGKAPTGR